MQPERADRALARYLYRKSPDLLQVAFCDEKRIQLLTEPAFGPIRPAFDPVNATLRQLAWRQHVLVLNPSPPE
jgi:hypothetical protein